MSDPAGTEIREAIRRTYAQCSSYEDEGEVTSTFHGPIGRFVRRRPFSTLFVRPYHFRFEFRERRGEEDWNQYVIWTRGGPVNWWWSVSPKGDPPESLRTAIAAAAGVSGGSSHTVPHLLLPEISGRRWLDLADLKYEGIETWQGTPCHRFTRPAAIKGLMTYRIDAGSFLLRCVQEARHVLRKGLRRAADSLPASIPPQDRAAILGLDRPGDDSTEVESETVYRSRLDQPIDPLRFEFVPPPRGSSGQRGD